MPERFKIKSITDEQSKFFSNLLDKFNVHQIGLTIFAFLKLINYDLNKYRGKLLCEYAFETSNIKVSSNVATTVQKNSIPVCRSITISSDLRIYDRIGTPQIINPDLQHIITYHHTIQFLDCLTINNCEKIPDIPPDFNYLVKKDMKGRYTIIMENGNIIPLPQYVKSKPLRMEKQVYV